MARRKKSNDLKAVAIPAQVDPIEAEAKQLTAELKRQKAKLVYQKAKNARLIWKHELKKEDIEQNLAKTKSNVNEKEEKHSKTMRKLKKETRKAEEAMKEVQAQAVGIEVDVEQKLENERKTLNLNRDEYVAAGRKQLSEAVTNNGGEPFAWQLCDICIEKFDGRVHAPKTLACGHTICERCHIRIYRNNGIIVCPLDRNYGPANEIVQGSRINVTLFELCK